MMRDITEAGTKKQGSGTAETNKQQRQRATRTVPFALQDLSLHSQRTTRLRSSTITFQEQTISLNISSQPTNKQQIDPRNADLQCNNTTTTRPLYTTHSDSTANSKPPRTIPFSITFYGPAAFLSILVCAQCGGTSILITSCATTTSDYTPDRHATLNFLFFFLFFFILHTKKSFLPHPEAPLPHTTTTLPTPSSLLTN
ncbi:hypothetical protein F5H01DRAFT_187754 [Linnemannia elongata]|nr:hypothetical protein F5H01DRAFT_187754 [Linnemannia elongata]